MKFYQKFFAALILLNFVDPLVCLKILIIAPATWYSHFMLNARMADVLVESGHYVVLFLFFRE
jgi:hypothetical protein